MAFINPKKIYIFIGKIYENDVFTINFPFFIALLAF